MSSSPVLDATHDPRRRSWVPVPPGSDFPIQNLPYGIFRCGGSPPRVGIAIGEFVLDLATLDAAGIFRGTPLDGQPLFERASLNPLLALGGAAWRAARRRISDLLDEASPELQGNERLRDAALVPQASATLMLPVEIGDYTDFYSSREHATNVGVMFRGPDNALMPNWLHLPVGYHGRASSVVVSGTPVRRPCGQTLPDGAAAPAFGPSRQLDFELEVGLFTGPGNALGQPIPLAGAHEAIFGFVLVNDWSARDIQKWEYQPLGPFLAKNFATSISPWVVTLDALLPFRVAGPRQDDPAPLPYLSESEPWSFDIALEVWLKTARMGERARIARSNHRHLYWNVRQQVAHHTVTGCNLRPGDLLASGTISGPTKDSRGSLLELSWRGTEPLALPSGETRTFLEDGDELTITGFAAKDGVRVGFGEVAGTVLPAHP
ncbi:MAG: fumarylacetoacetase [Acidobacteria bacterium]|jgi:fumarylacetoacetase|nr:fumarylacetoacetase [Acidobacteriota bacterium]